MGPDEDEFPPPLRPTKIPRPVTTEPMSQKFRCCVCRTNEGILTCTRCRSVRYCEKKCQKKQWPTHKKICAEIKIAFEETERTAIMIKHFFDLFEVEQYFEGRQHFEGVDYRSEDLQGYEAARRDLIYALKKCGETNRSELAFDLAAGNLMDMMLLRYKEYWYLEGAEDLASYLINAGLDQEAYDYVRYFYIRDESQEALPYLSVDPQDIEATLSQADVNNLRLHDMMVIALVKYKRMRHLEFQEICETIRFKNFLMGTHPRVGKDSPVIKIRGMSIITHIISNYILKPWKNRIHKLHQNIEVLLKSANENQYVIPGILNPESLPAIENRPMWINDQGELQSEATQEEMIEDSKIRDAHVTVEKTARAWILATMRDVVFLQGFLNTGSLPNPKEMPRIELIVSEQQWKGRECNLSRKELYRSESIYDLESVSNLLEALRALNS